MAGQSHGRAAEFHIEDSGGTIRDVSTDLNDITIDITVNNPEDTAFGDTFITRSASGLRDYSMSVSGWYDDTASTGIETVLQGILAEIGVFKYLPGGSVTGNRIYSGCVVLDSYGVTSPVDGMITLTAAFSGAAGSLTTACAV